MIAVVILVLIVPMLGVLAALGIYGVRRYLQSAKTSEAKNTVGALIRAEESAFERTKSEEGRGRLCEASKPVPSSMGEVAGRKYLPSAGDFDNDAGWKCLKFSLSSPIYYQYGHYRSGFVSGLVSGTEAFEIRAHGDLDADGKPSTFARAGEVDGSGSLKVSSQLFVSSEFE
ncbi:MAG: fimbiral protein pilA [Polyangiaceae bacterium]|nr:fimbiral protein pilA [Polyangiaceae bacterium]